MPSVKGYQLINRKRIVCGLCDRQLNSMKLAELHYKVEHREPLRVDSLWRCLKCKVEFQSEELLSEHITSKCHFRG